MDAVILENNFELIFLVRCTRLMLCICYINLALVKEIDIIALVNKLINWLWLLNDEKTLELKIFENKSEHLRNQHPYTNDNNFFSNVTVTLIRCLIVTLSNAIQYMKINSKQVITLFKLFFVFYLLNIFI